MSRLIDITDSTRLKVGDILVAIKNHNDGTASDAFTKGKEYQVLDVAVNGEPTITVNHNYLEWGVGSPIGRMSISLADLRKWVKLKQRDFKNSLEKDLYEIETMGYPYK